MHRQQHLLGHHPGLRHHDQQVRGVPDQRRVFRATPICAANVCTVCQYTRPVSRQEPRRSSLLRQRHLRPVHGQQHLLGQHPGLRHRDQQMRGVPDQRGMLGRHAHLREQQLHRLHDGRQCLAKNPAAPACATSGTSAGQCVACIDNSTCSGSTPVCDTHGEQVHPVPDQRGMLGRYAYLHEPGLHRLHHPRPMRAKNATVPACAPARLRAVTDNNTCAAPHPSARRRPIPARVHGRQRMLELGPGVCMSHQDGRCASSVETIVVAAGGALPTVGQLTSKRLVVVQGHAPAC